MVIPLYDINPRRAIRVPWVTYALILACVFIYIVFQSGLAIDANFASVIGFGMVPADFPGLDLSTSAGLPEPLTLLTYMFLHGGWVHLFGNMLFLWVFGDNVEDAMGSVRFLIFYLLTGVAAGVAFAISAPHSTTPLVGASGAIAGIVAAYLLLYPRVKMWVLVLMRVPLKLSAMWVIGGWLAFQIVNALVNVNQETAWWAHVGGFVTGVVLTPFLRHPDVPLFGRDRVA
ncbi:MAG: rhomboid family intramembrane serine protease [Variibacter sp.]